MNRLLIALAVLSVNGVALARTPVEIIGNIQNDVQGCGEDFDVDSNLNIRTTWHSYAGSPGFYVFTFNAHDIDQTSLTELICKRVGCVTKQFRIPESEGSGSPPLRPTRQSTYEFVMACSQDPRAAQELTGLWDELHDAL